VADLLTAAAWLLGTYLMTDRFMGKRASVSLNWLQSEALGVNHSGKSKTALDESRSSGPDLTDNYKKLCDFKF
jgi:hypothetical protein